jgi:DNA gyrase/topoisomerase IV subunit B
MLGKIFWIFPFLIMMGCVTPSLSNNGICEVEPSWAIKPPSKKGYLYGVGIAPQNFNGESAQRTSAISKAINEIASQMNTTVNSQLLLQSSIYNKSSAHSLALISFQTIDGEKVRMIRIMGDEKELVPFRGLLSVNLDETPVYDLTVNEYHNFAIKSGEDSSIFVHNSHIQTLLMTFFFRFLHPIIEKGYLYLAQPPLYRYKKGKNETYLKDDKALNDFLIENGIDAIESETMGQRDLVELFKLVAYYKMTLKEIEKRFALIEALRYMIENPDIAGLETSKLDTTIQEYIKELGYNILNKTITEDRLHYFVQTNDGLEELIIDDVLFTNPHFNEAIHIYQKIQKHITDEFRDKDLIELFEKVEANAKKGAYIQRYKGLGEMNPDQLWDTTMAPENRRLLRVTIDDIESASKTFTLFMGDEVEPRRAYIETHAKDVKHLDI